MFKNSSTFYRVIVHTVGALFLIGILGSTALGGEDILSGVVSMIYRATFGPVEETATQQSTGSPLVSPLQVESGNPGPYPPPPDTLD